MKKILYIVLLIAEVLTGLVSIGLLYSWLGWISFIAVAATVIILEVILVLSLKKQAAENDEAGMKKTRRKIALVLLIPTVLAFAIGAYTIVSMLIYFS